MVGRKRKSPAIPPQDKQPEKLRKTKGSGRAARVKKAKVVGQDGGVCKRPRKMNLPKKSRSSIPMDQLPMEVLEKLVTYLDVVSLTRLASTNNFFKQLISGRFLLNVNFPFDQAFLDELGAASVIDKKPVLSLTCSQVVAIFPKSTDSRPVCTTLRSLKYLIKLQLSMLDLSRLQDLTLGAADQAARGIPCTCGKCKIELNVAKNFDACFIEQLGLGLMSHLRCLRFDIDDIRIDNDDVLQLIRGGGLQSLTIIVSTLSALHRLERIVPLVKAPELTVKVLCVVNKKPSPRLLFNTAVKKLRVRGPCDLQFHVEMSQVEHILVKPLDEGTEYGQESGEGMPCNFSAQARARHGVGQCCVDIRAILKGHCPNLKTFCGLSLRESSGRMKSKQQVKKLLHEDYIANGGALGLSEWSKGHWRGRNLNMASGYFVAYVI